MEEKRPSYQLNQPWLLTSQVIGLHINQYKKDKNS